MYHEFMLLHTIQKWLYATHLPNSSVTCYIASCFFMLNKKTTPWNAQICSKCNGIGKENVKDQEEYKNSITKGENSFNRYYRYTKCSYLFSFTHNNNNENHPHTSFLKHPRIATSYSSCFPLAASAACLTNRTVLCVSKWKWNVFHEKLEKYIKVTRWFHAKYERTQTNLEYGHRRQTNFLFCFFSSFPPH